MIFCDLDGVLADFDRGFQELFGRPKSNNGPAEDEDWERVRGTKGFYENLPPMPDMMDLWSFIKPFSPVILTGIPKLESVPEATDNKVAWVNKHLPGAITICCLSKEKAKYCHPGDILIDDWERHKKKWIRAGGIWITHISAKESIRQLQQVMNG